MIHLAERLRALESTVGLAAKALETGVLLDGPSRTVLVSALDALEEHALALDRCFADGRVLTLTYGTLPSREVFDRLFNARCPDGLFTGRNHRPLEHVIGTEFEFTASELWQLLEQCRDGWQDNHELGDFAADVLERLGVEWI